MRGHQRYRVVSAIALLACWLTLFPGSAWAAPAASNVSSPRKETVKKYFNGCRGKAARDANCEKLRTNAIEVLKDTLQTLGSTADRAYLPNIVGIFKSEEVELRIAAADA